MPGNYPEESIQHSEHGESLKSRNFFKCLVPAVRWVPPSKEKVVTKGWTVEESQIDSSQEQEIISVLKSAEIDAGRP